MTEEAIRALLKEAYKFGYFVGYHGHSEWAEWVRKTRERFYKEAERLSVYDLIKEAYQRGKEDGAKQREEDIRKGIFSKEAGGAEHKKARVEVPEQEEAAEESEEFANFLGTAKILLPPDLLSAVKTLDPPKMLKKGDGE